MSKRPHSKNDEDGPSEEPKIKLPKSLLTCKTYEAIISMHKNFPQLKFYNKVPPAIMIHQLYDIIPSRTVVDREVVNLRIQYLASNYFILIIILLDVTPWAYHKFNNKITFCPIFSQNNLRSNGVICVFQLGIDLKSRAIILAEDMLIAAEVCYPGKSLVNKFLEKVIPMGLIEIEKMRLETLVSKAEVKYEVFVTPSTKFLINCPGFQRTDTLRVSCIERFQVVQPIFSQCWELC
jgi:hypothetical protein